MKTIIDSQNFLRSWELTSNKTKVKYDIIQCGNAYIDFICNDLGTCLECENSKKLNATLQYLCDAHK